MNRVEELQRYSLFGVPRVRGDESVQDKAPAETNRRALWHW